MLPKDGRNGNKMLNLLLFLVAIFLLGASVGIAFANRKWRSVCDDWRIIAESATAAAKVNKERAEKLAKMLDELMSLSERVLARNSGSGEGWDRDDRRV